MSTTISDGSLAVLSDTTQNAGDGYSSEKGEDGKEKFWCIYCPYNVESATKAAIKRHLTTKHAPKANNSPLTKNGIKRYFKGTDDGKEKETEDKRPKIDESRDEYVKVDKADKGSEGSYSLLQSTQNNKTTNEDELEEMLNELKME